MKEKNSDWLLMYTPDDLFIAYKQPSILESKKGKVSSEITLKKLVETCVLVGKTPVLVDFCDKSYLWSYTVKNGTYEDLERIEGFHKEHELDYHATTKLIETMFGVSLS